jgi:hypothetical protein
MKYDFLLYMMFFSDCAILSIFNQFFWNTQTEIESRWNSYPGTFFVFLFSFQNFFWIYWLDAYQLVARPYNILLNVTKFMQTLTTKICHEWYNYTGQWCVINFILMMFLIKKFNVPTNYYWNARSTNQGHQAEERDIQVGSSNIQVDLQFKSAREHWKLMRETLSAFWLYY